MATHRFLLRGQLHAIPIFTACIFSLLFSCVSRSSEEGKKISGSAEVPDFVLEDMLGREFRLSHQQGAGTLLFQRLGRECLSAIEVRQGHEGDEKTIKRYYLWTDSTLAREVGISSEYILKDSELLASGLLGLWACGDSTEINAGTSTVLKKANSPPPARLAVDFRQDILPLFSQRCLPCHRDGGAGPWQMNNRERLMGWSQMIKEVVLTKRMPPWGHSLEYRKVKNLPGLSDFERALIVNWVEQGARIDSSGEDPVKKAHDQFIAALSTREKLAKTAGEIEYRHPPIVTMVNGGAQESWVNVDLEFNFEKDVWVKAASVRPTNPKVVHHAFLFIDYPKERKSEQPLWVKGMGIDGNNGFFSSFGPGYEKEFVGEFPEGTGKLIPKGAKGRMQIHYVPTGKDEVSEIHLKFVLLKKKPSKVFQVMSSQSQDFSIPPFSAETVFSTHIPVQKNIKIYEVCPHMHLRGKYMNFFVQTKNNGEFKFFGLPRFRPSWQSCFRFERPLAVSAGSRIVVRGAFDNSKLNPSNPDPSVTVSYGQRSTDEMFLPFIGYTEN